MSTVTVRGEGASAYQNRRIENLLLKAKWHQREARSWRGTPSMVSYHLMYMRDAARELRRTAWQEVTRLGSKHSQYDVARHKFLAIEERACRQWRRAYDKL